MAKLKNLRCQGKNKKGRECGQLLYKYFVTENEVVIEIKCNNCNSFNILRIQLFCKNQTGATKEMK